MVKLSEYLSRGSKKSEVSWDADHTSITSTTDDSFLVNEAGCEFVPESLMTFFTEAKNTLSKTRSSFREQLTKSGSPRGPEFLFSEYEDIDNQRRVPMVEDIDDLLFKQQILDRYQEENCGGSVNAFLSPTYPTFSLTSSESDKAADSPFEAILGGSESHDEQVVSAVDEQDEELTVSLIVKQAQLVISANEDLIRRTWEVNSASIHGKMEGTVSPCHNSEALDEKKPTHAKGQCGSERHVDVMSVNEDLIRRTKEVASTATQSNMGDPTGPSPANKEAGVDQQSNNEDEVSERHREYIRRSEERQAERGAAKENGAVLEKSAGAAWKLSNEEDSTLRSRQNTVASDARVHLQLYQKGLSSDCLTFPETPWEPAIEAAPEDIHNQVCTADLWPFQEQDFSLDVSHGCQTRNGMPNEKESQRKMNPKVNHPNKEDEATRCRSPPGRLREGALRSDSDVIPPPPVASEPDSGRDQVRRTESGSPMHSAKTRLKKIRDARARARARVIKNRHHRQERNETEDREAFGERLVAAKKKDSVHNRHVKWVHQLTSKSEGGQKPVQPPKTTVSPPRRNSHVRCTRLPEGESEANPLAPRNQHANCKAVQSPLHSKKFKMMSEVPKRPQQLTKRHVKSASSSTQESLVRNVSAHRVAPAPAGILRRWGSATVTPDSRKRLC